MISNKTSWDTVTVVQCRLIFKLVAGKTVFKAASATVGSLPAVAVTRIDF